MLEQPHFTSQSSEFEFGVHNTVSHFGCYCTKHNGRSAESEKGDSRRRSCEHELVASELVLSDGMHTVMRLTSLRCQVPHPRVSQRPAARKESVATVASRGPLAATSVAAHCPDSASAEHLAGTPTEGRVAAILTWRVH